jgi:hypothetical protein
VTEVIVDELDFCDSKNAATNKPTNTVPDDSEIIPF